MPRQQIGETCMRAPSSFRLISFTCVLPLPAAAADTVVVLVAVVQTAAAAAAAAGGADGICP